LVLTFPKAILKGAMLQPGYRTPNNDDYVLVVRIYE
jgi:hypothetical protein